MSAITGRAKKFDGTAIDYVSIFNWVDGRSIAQIIPNAAGEWSYSYFDNLNIGIAYVADGCEPIMHGPYQLIAKWSPLSLFKNNKQGFWYDPSDLLTMFTDVQGTQQVTQDGDRVAVMLDKSGNNRNLVQPVVEKRLIYKTDGVKHWLTGDGVDDFLSSSASFDLSSGSISLMTANKSIGNNSSTYAYVVISGDVYQGVNVNRTTLHTRPNIGENNGIAINVADDAQPKISTMLLNKQTRDLKGYINGVSQGTVAIAGTDWYSSPSNFVLGANRLINFPIYSKTNFYGAIMIQDLISDEDRSLVDQYLAENSGAILT